ncbi:MAG: 1-acyl-sn-glycerol-3-phosphate acyltransferase [Gammaproteobacteria bacterium]|nr:MAG: 1-acyl-sn-glycerol-3-phosphate acyltransferase [Gammaproteobacteria bacterium]
MLVQYLLAFIVRVLVGARALWIGCKPSDAVRIYFANHTSHMDTIALWCALPSNLRAKTRPVAAADYWHGGFRGWLARHGFNALLIDRAPGNRDRDPLAPLAQALERGESLIIFPEGTRRAQALPGEFKSGIFYLARQAPAAELVPVYLDNLYRSMPKGTLLPVPLTCAVRFGAPLQRVTDETKEAFLARARQAVVDLA